MILFFNYLEVEGLKGIQQGTQGSQNPGWATGGIRKPTNKLPKQNAPLSPSMSGFSEQLENGRNSPNLLEGQCITGHDLNFHLL